MPSELERLLRVQYGQPRIQPEVSVEYGTPIIEEIPDVEPRYVTGPATIAEAPAAAAAAGQPGARRSDSDVFERMLSRVSTGRDTGIAQAGEGQLPASALRPEVQRLFAPYGGASMIDVTNLSPEESRMLSLWVDPRWMQRQQNPGAGLTEAERAEAMRRGRRGT